MLKNLLRLFYVLAALVLLFITIKWLRWFGAPHFPEIKFDPQKVTEFSIKSPGSDLVFSKNKKGWSVEEKRSKSAYDADPENVKMALDGIAGIKIAEVISNNPARQPEFQVDSSSGVLIEVKVPGKPPVSFVLGRQNYGLGNHYFRFSGLNQIRLSEGVRRRFMERGLNYWRDSRIIRMDRAKITRIEVNYPSKPGQDLVLTLTPGTTDRWVAENVRIGGTPKKADFNSILKPLLYTVSDLIHDGFVPKDRKWGKTKFSVKVTGKEGTREILVGDTITESSGKYKDNYNLVKCAGDETIYKIHDFKAENLAQQKSDLK